MGCPGTAFTGSLGGPGPLRASRLAPRHPRLMHTISQAEGRGNRLPVPAPEQRSVADTPGPAVPGPRGSTSPHPRHLPRLLRPRATLLLPAANPPPLLSTPPGEVARQLLQFQTQPRLGTLARRERAHLTCTYSPGSTGLKLPGRPSAELALAQPVPAAQLLCYCSNEHPYWGPCGTSLCGCKECCRGAPFCLHPLSLTVECLAMAILTSVR